MVGTVTWVLGLVLMAGAFGHALAGTTGAVVAVGAVLFFAGVAADYWGGV